MTRLSDGADQDSGPFHLDTAPPRRRHDEATEFTVLVLWLTGFSAGAIAARLGLRRGQVLGIVGRSASRMAGLRSMVVLSTGSIGGSRRSQTRAGAAGDEFLDQQ
jgi:hypothetical protein